MITGNRNSNSPGDSSGNPSITSSIIGSRKSAFQPYKPITILTNLQRGNVRTSTREVTSQSLTFHEKAARGELNPEDINTSNVNSLDETGKTPLIWASFHSHFPTVQMLVDHGANVNIGGRRMDTPLMYAASNGHLAVINYLISKGADVDGMDLYENTPLIYATIGNHAQCVTSLLENGASLMHTNMNGDSAFSIACHRRLLSAQFAIETFLRDFIESNCVKVMNNRLIKSEGEDRQFESTTGVQHEWGIV